MNQDDVDNRQEANSLLWLVYLYFMPTTFFQSFVLKSTPALTLLCTWVYGIAGVIDRMDSRIAEGRTGFYGLDWSSYWVSAVGLGALGGLIYYLIGGWWYRVRLSLSGAKGIDRALARRVYVFASLVMAIPTLFLALSETQAHDTPFDASLAPVEYWHAFLLLFPFWSLFTSYKGVRTSFDVRPGWARVWFLILPFLFYFLFVLLSSVFLFKLLDSLETSEEPQQESTQQAYTPSKKKTDPHAKKVHNANLFSIFYPGTWEIDRKQADYDFNENITLMPIDHHAMVNFRIDDSDLDAVQSMEAMIRNIRETVINPKRISSFDSVGKNKGTGRLYKGEIEGEGMYNIRLFTAPFDDGRIFEMVELYLCSEESEVMPDLELIRSSLKIRF